MRISMSMVQLLDFAFGYSDFALLVLLVQVENVCQSIQRSLLP